jgi:mono/diheme cytochrome c family protein
MKYLPVVAVVTLLAGASALAQTTPHNKPVSVDLPAANYEFKDGPNVNLARSRCIVCHSSDYVYMQPPLTQKQWTNEVNKMVKAYGATIPPEEVEPIVQYLMSQNGKT